MQETAGRFNAQFEALLTANDAVPDQLREAVRYSALAPGKRVRPFLVFRCCELSGGTVNSACPAAAAIECIHAFSLVHDDLPAMDDDDLRRGQPTCHVKFGEGMAVLAGDALVALAFELIAREASDNPNALAMVSELADAMGWSGMIGGQAADILGEKQPLNRQLAEYIHKTKTARLFQSACRLGFLSAGGNASANELYNSLSTYGLELGLAFQIADDLLDLTSTSEQLGKAAGKDNSAGKQTIPQAVGMEESRRIANEHVNKAQAAIEHLGPSADDLRQLARLVVERSS